MFDAVFDSISVIVGAAFQIGSSLFDKYFLSNTDASTFYLMLLSAAFVFGFIDIIVFRRRGSRR